MTTGPEGGDRSHADFAAFVDAKLSHALTELDLEARRRHRRLLTGCLALPIGVGLSTGILALLPGAGWAGIFALAAAAWFLWSIHTARLGFARAFRERVIGPLASYVHEDLRYDPDAQLPSATLEASGLIRQDIGICRSEDMVTGTIDGVAVRCAYVKALERRPPEVRHGDRTSPSAVFRGLFVVAEFPKRARGTTYVFPDRTERLLGEAARLFQAADRRYGGLVHLEDPVFERQFKVYSDDQVEARYVLSTSLMDRLVRFRRRRDTAPRLSVRDSFVYLAFASDENPLAPPEWAEVAYTQKTASGRALMLERLAGYLDDLRLSVDVVRDLALDVRIWDRAPRAGTPHLT